MFSRKIVRLKGKKAARLRRAKRTRMRIRELGAHRLCVHRSLMHMYAQVIAPNGSEVLVSASTLDGEIKKQIKEMEKTAKKRQSGNKQAATIVGKAIAERALAAGIKKVAFDASGRKYHGRVKALAEAAREGGLEF